MLPPPTTPLPMAGEVLDRVAERRSDLEWLAGRHADAGSRVLPVLDQHVAASRGEDGAIRLAFRSPAGLSAGDLVLLGVDARGDAVFAVDAEAQRPADEQFVHLRDVAALLGPAEAGLAAHAVALLGWHRRHRHCSVCGAPTEMIEAGHMRRCTNPADASVHHPRTDPCVIVLVHDGDRVLLGRRPTFPPGRFSVLAGFVEPGETLEAAVAREVEEESGVTVRADTVDYVASQPWPFPASLMLGFTAAAASTDIAPRDGELEEVRWMSREELRRGAAVGDVLLPPPASIARHLLDMWIADDAT
jgi:NAD+ diphosphatase